MPKPPSAFPLNGVFLLKEPADLLAKLAHDLARLKAEPADAYAAMDFFATADHLLDWIHPGDASRTTRTDERKAEVLLQVVHHLATGAKHFRAEGPHHESVGGTGRQTIVRPAKRVVTPWGAPQQRGAIRYDCLYVDLEGAAAEKFGKRLDAHDLAGRVYAHWERRLTSST